MLNRLKKIVQTSSILKISSLNSLSVVVKMITGLGVAKLSAYFFGPQGLALIGNYRNFLNIAHNFSTAGLERAAVKYAVDSQNSVEKQQSFISSLLGVGIVICFLIGLLIYSFSFVISDWLFFESNYTAVIHVLAFVLPLHVFNVYLIAILKAYEKFGSIIKIQIIGHLLNIGIFIIFVVQFNLKGALLAITIVPSTLVFFSLYYFKAHWSILNLFSWKSMNKNVLQNFGHYALMTLVSSISFPLAFLGIRTTLINQLSEFDAGLWEAINQIARYYLMFVLSLLNLFILPKLIKAETTEAFKNVVFNFYKQILPFYIAGLMLVYFLRRPLLQLVFTSEFLAAEELFTYQLLGDFFRIVSLVMVYQFHAKKMTLAFILTDLFLVICLYAFSVILIREIGIEGAVLGHFIAYALYFIVILLYFRKTFVFPLFEKKRA